MGWLDTLLASFSDPKFLIVQGVGALGFAIYIASYQILSPRKTILAQAASQPFFIAHYYGLDHLFLAVLGLSAAARDLSTALVDNPRVHQIIMIVNLVWLLALGLFFAKVSGDVMGLVGSLASSVSHFFRGHFYAYRGLMLTHNVMWTATNIYAGSVPGGVVMVGITLSNVIGIVRYVQAQRAA